MSRLLTARHAAKIRGVLSCFDRIVLTATLPDICFPEGMTAYLGGKGIKIFDFQKQWAQPLNDEIRKNAERLAEEAGVTIEYISRRNFRKEERIKNILAERGTHPGLIHIFSGIEPCTEYRPWYDKKSGKA